MRLESRVNCPDCKAQTTCKTDGKGRRTWVCIRCDHEVETTELPSGARIARTDQ
jgi:transposase-like protein